jgi:hypothetical protein
MVAKVNVYGLGETLKELYYLDRTLYNGIRKGIKAPADELVRRARTSSSLRSLLSATGIPPQSVEEPLGSRTGTVRRLGAALLPFSAEGLTV